MGRVKPPPPPQRLRQRLRQRFLKETSHFSEQVINLKSKVLDQGLQKTLGKIFNWWSMVLEIACQIQLETKKKHLDFLS